MGNCREVHHLVGLLDSDGIYLSHAHELGHFTKRQYLIYAKLGTPKTVGNYLRDLEQEDFLKSVIVGKEKLYLNYRLMEILDKQ